MARKPRIEFPNALYHVIARGNHRNKIFLGPGDFQKYLDLIARYKKRHNLKLYAYALMDNHLHLLIETSSVPLSKTMQGLQQSYTQFFNLKYGKVGHLFQGRYKAIACQKDNYLLELIRYIHLNPIRAGLVKKLSDYPWISHGHYLKEKKDELIDTDFVLEQFGPNKVLALHYYEEFIREGINEPFDAFADKVVDDRILGKKDFIEKVLKDKSQFGIEKNKNMKKLKLEKVLTIICQNCSVLPGAVKSNVKLKDIVLARRLFIYVARVYFGYPLKEIASFLEIDITTTTKSVAAINEQLKRRGIVANIIRESLKKLHTECTEFQA